jgi:hypothetical protein
VDEAASRTRVAAGQRPLQAATVVLAAAYLLSTIVGLRSHSELADAVLMESALVAATALAGARAVLVREERWISGPLAAAIGLWTAGNAAWLVMAARSSAAPARRSPTSASSASTRPPT